MGTAARSFGENLTAEGLTLADAALGEWWWTGEELVSLRATYVGGGEVEVLPGLRTGWRSVRAFGAWPRSGVLPGLASARECYRRRLGRISCDSVSELRAYRVLNREAP